MMISNAIKNILRKSDLARLNASYQIKTILNIENNVLANEVDENEQYSFIQVFINGVLYNMML